MFSHLCRVCLAQFNDPSDVVPLFEPHENVYYYRICHELQLLVYEDDQLGSNVCRSCSESIMKFYKFVLTYKESDQKLREMLINATVTLDELIEVKPNVADFECDVKDTTDLINVEADAKEYFPKLTISPILDRSAVSRNYEESRTKAVSRKVQMQCRLCQEKFTLRRYLEKHMRQQHLKGVQEKPNATHKYECDICSKTFISKTKIRQHLITHINEGRRFLCVACGNQFCSKFDLAQHISAIHEKEQKFQCTKCNRRLAHKHNLKTHMNRHNGIRPYACSVCSKSLCIGRNSALNNVKMMIQICPICGFIIRNLYPSNLVEHMKSHDPRIQCQSCGKQLAARNLVRHTKNCVPREPNLQFVCTSCGRSYASAQTLARHTRKFHSTL